MVNEVNKVGGVQHPVEVRKQAHVTVQESVKVEISFPKGAQENKPVEFNLYGKDLENFEKFKGNDKHDAMRMTTSAANDVKVAYMQLQHEFPDVSISFEPMPDPKRCGKKREGFITYQQQLEDWKDVALMQIANAREASTTSKINDAAGAVIANDNANAAMNAELTVAAADAIVENDNKNAEKINRNIDQEGASTRAAVSEEGVKTRNAVHAEGAITRDTVRGEHARTRNLVREEAVDNRNAIREEGADTRNTTKETAKQTQEIQSLSEKISDILNNGSQLHTTETMKKVGELRDKIIAADVFHETKVELLNKLADFANQGIITSKEVARMNNMIDEELRNSGRELPEEPYPEKAMHELPPRKETPITESANDGVEHPASAEPQPSGNSKNQPSEDLPKGPPIIESEKVKIKKPKEFDNYN